MKLAIEDHERKEEKDDGMVHYISAIEECAGRYLRVVVNPNIKPRRIVTLFFNRRIRKKLP